MSADVRVRTGNRPGQWREEGPGSPLSHHTVEPGELVTHVRASTRRRFPEWRPITPPEPPEGHRLSPQTLQAAREVCLYGTGNSQQIAVMVLRTGSVRLTANLLSVAISRVRQALGMQ